MKVVGLDIIRIGASNNTPKDDTIYFTIKPTTEVIPSPIPWWKIGLIMLAVIGVGGATYYASRKKK